jgi:hypothetical protein
MQKPLPIYFVILIRFPLYVDVKAAAHSERFSQGVHMSLSYADVRKKVVLSEGRFNRLNLLIAEEGFSHSRVWRAVMNREFDSPEKMDDAGWIEEMDLHVKAALAMGYKKPF